jgi:Proline dehydrogenase
MARQFIAGRNPHEVIATLRKRRAQKIGFTVDVLGEAVVSEAEADEYAAIYGDLLEKLARETRDWTDPLGKNAELFPVVNLSVKISALYSQMSPAAPADAIAHLSTKLRPLLRRARELGAFINFDMESYALKNTTLELFKTILTERSSKIGRMPGLYPGLFARFRGRFARFDRVGAWTRHSLRSPTGERRILGLRDNEIGPERIESSGLSSKARERREFRKAYARAF